MNFFTESIPFDSDKLDQKDAPAEKDFYVSVCMRVQKSTKNTIRFEEITPTEIAAPKLGTIYVPKSTLNEIGWSEGKNIYVTLQVSKPFDKLSDDPLKF